MEGVHGSQYCSHTMAREGDRGESQGTAVYHRTIFHFQHMDLLGLLAEKPWLGHGASLRGGRKVSETCASI